MSRLSDLAESRRQQIDEVASAGAARVVRLWSTADPADLDGEWDERAPRVVDHVAAAQLQAVSDASRTTAFATTATVVSQAFTGVTREGRDVGAELFSAVTYTKSLIGRGLGVGQAFRAGTALMSVLAANTIRDAGRSADGVVGVSSGRSHYVRVVQPGACSRCAILAGSTTYRTAFERHPACKCSAMWVPDGSTPDGFYASASDYFDSLSAVEQDRVFTKSGAWAIRNGADPSKVVNARRGALSTTPDAPSVARLRPVTIGKRADGSPLQVYATYEGTTARSRWARQQGLDRTRRAGERYRRTSSLRLMPEQIMQMSNSVEHATELLRKYGYIR